MKAGKVGDRDRAMKLAFEEKFNPHTAALASGHAFSAFAFSAR